MDSGAEPPQEREIDHGELIDQLHWACRIADLSGVDLFITDAHSGRFLDCSRSAHERLGYSRAELLAMGAEQIQADPDHDAAWLQQQLQLLRQQQQGCFTTRHRCRNGNVLDVLVNHTVAQLNGRLVIITAVIDTVIERLEERIRAARVHTPSLSSCSWPRTGCCRPTVPSRARRCPGRRRHWRGRGPAGPPGRPPDRCRPSA